MLGNKPKGKKKAIVRRRQPKAKQEGQKQGQIQTVNVYTQAPTRRRTTKPRVTTSQQPQAIPMFQTFYIQPPQQQLLQSTKEATKEAVQPKLNIAETVSGNVDSVLQQATPIKPKKKEEDEEDIELELRQPPTKKSEKLPTIKIEEPKLTSDQKKNNLRTLYRQTFGVSKEESQQAGYGIKYLEDTINRWLAYKDKNPKADPKIWILSNKP